MMFTFRCFVACLVKGLNETLLLVLLLFAINQISLGDVFWQPISILYIIGYIINIGVVLIAKPKKTVTITLSAFIT